VPGFTGGDRIDIRLPDTQRTLLSALEATGKPVIVVLQSGSAVPLGDQGKNARAILQAWYGGEQGGHAIADVLSGAYNPAGRLPITVYRGIDQLPAFADYSMKKRTYRYFAGPPEYPFGYGLSYAKFGYSDVQLRSAQLPAGTIQNVSVRVRNESSVAGDEVVQLYVATPGRSDAPLRSLKGFERIHLRPGEERMVQLQLEPRDLALAGQDGVMRISPGEYRLWIGGGQQGTGAAGAAATFQMSGEVALQP
jgi:beta-glucosidase